MRDRRTRAGKNQLLGYPFRHVRYSIIKNGSVDFDREYHGRFGRLCSDDLVALYRYLYMPRHMAEAMATFDRCSTWVAKILNSTTITWMVDLGCGPGTVGLAFAGHCGGVTFNYDYSRALGMCHSPINVIFATSYLFASTSLDIDAIIRSLKSVIDCDTVKEALFVYLNSTTRFANRFYERFVGCVDIDCEPCFEDRIAVISLGWAYEMEFQHSVSMSAATLMLAPGSLLVLSGPSRYEWTHQIRARYNDHGISRQRRVSLTFRKVLIEG